ncbi:cytochrome P450 71A1-like [Magnolia sinica]|uniref:cytochrome P450 71A1-like n=1 Tax=Magnolia sinica TaxID=86752 RepID=UPI00265986D3|nr:cytochrome P450 71A1-like [Magnolia sinica]
MWYWRRRIEALSRSFLVRFSHCPREANSPADELARMGSDDRENLLFLDVSALPAKIRGLIFLDKIGLVFFLSSFSSPKRKPTHLPPSPPQLPIISNLHQLGNLSHRSLWHLSQKYGPLMYLKLGSLPTLVISSAKLASHIMKTQDIIFCNRPLFVSYKKLSYNFSDLAFTPYREYYKNMCKIFNNELLTSRESSHLDSLGRMRLLYTIISRAALSKSYRGGGEKTNFHSVFEEAQASLTAFFYTNYIPWLGWIDVVTGQWARLEKSFRELDEFYEKVIHEHLDPKRVKQEQEDLENIPIPSADDPFWRKLGLVELSPWSPDAQMVEEETWIRLFGIPSHAWFVSVICDLGSCFGEVTQIDTMSIGIFQMFARIKVINRQRASFLNPIQFVVAGKSYDDWAHPEDKETSVESGAKEAPSSHSDGSPAPSAICRRCTNSNRNPSVPHSIAATDPPVAMQEHRPAMLTESTSEPQLQHKPHLPVEPSSPPTSPLDQVRLGELAEERLMLPLLPQDENALPIQCKSAWHSPISPFPTRLREKTNFHSVFEEAQASLTAFFYANYIPWLGWIDVVTGQWARLEKSFRELDEFYKKVINEHLDPKRVKQEQEDLVDALIRVQKDLHLSRDNIKALLMVIHSSFYLPNFLGRSEKFFFGGYLSGSGLAQFILSGPGWTILAHLGMDYFSPSRTQMTIKIYSSLMLPIYFLQDIFIARTDTGAAMVVWAMTELVKKPRMMKKVQEEIRKIIGNKGKVEEDDLHLLDSFKLVVKETFRMHPAAPMLVPHETTRQCRLDGYIIAPKTLVLINALAIGQEPESWKNLGEFCLERFTDSSIDYKGQDFQFIPFGAGRRICLGMHFGAVTVEIALANLLYSFNWELPLGMNKEDVDKGELTGITVHKKSPLLLVPIKYINSTNGETNE